MIRKDINLKNSSQKCSYSTVPLAEKKVFSGDEILEIILKSLEAMKAEDIISIDLYGKSSLVDYVVIASAHSQRHISAVSEYLLSVLKNNGCCGASVEGLARGDWVLIDTGDIIVHLFRPEVRLFYNLEKMWLTPDLENAQSVLFGDY
ncbi:ribosome silencing factor [Bartonella sp. CB189]|uniref:ribosome silencing factor n=1 Tax=Bartonella sp. CB189 TaxID=3112254 RepID=UPI002F96D140